MAEIEMKDDSMTEMFDNKEDFLRKLARTRELEELDPKPEADSTGLPELYRAAMEGNWKIAKFIFDINEEAKERKLSNLGMTALHVAASCGQSEFVEELVRILHSKQLEATDQLGRTALHHVALAADVDAAKAMVKKNSKLPYLGDFNKRTPLFYAAKWRHPSESRKMVQYLYQVTQEENLPRDVEDGDACNAFTDDSATDLIVEITASGSYDIALRILRRHPELAIKRNNQTLSILHVLAMQPQAFLSGNKLPAWKVCISWMYDWVQGDMEETKYEDSTSGIRKMVKTKQRHLLAVRLIEFVCEELQEKGMEFVEKYFFPKDSTAILHLAVEHGVFELVQGCLKHFPDLIWYADTAIRRSSSLDAQYTYTATRRLSLHDVQHAETATGRMLLHVAIEHRQVKIFNYIINFIGKNTKAFAELKLQGKNNILHLAAKLAPTPQLEVLPGPLFQMQRELQWFNAVEALVYFELRMEKNSDEKTPRELFVDAHKDLLSSAKDWIKDTSNSCMVVATLVATVAFAAMITVPGGNESSTGIPVLAKKRLFVAFSISNALSMISSAVSLLMFLSISMLTSKCSEEDFLDSLPKILLSALTFLLVAVATMMISFGTAIGLSLQTRLNWAYIPITVVACFPVLIFTLLQLPLFLKMFVFKTGPVISHRQRDRKIWCLRKFGYRPLANDRI